MSESAVKRARVDAEVDLPLDLSIKPKSTATEAQKTRQNSVNFPNYSQNNSTNFKNPALIPDNFPSDIPTRLLSLEYSLTKTLQEILFVAPVEYLYSPIEYAFSVHLNYLQKFCKNNKKILFLGMNPGPWGMSQTGIPFGEVNTVVNWLKLSGNVDKPPREQPDRRITGFLCKRSEVSGKRFWDLFKLLCCTPEVFFRHSFLRNYCPVALMDAGGRNITPAELKGPEQSRLIELCDWFLGESVKVLKVEKIIGVGRFAEKRARHVVKSFGLTTQVVWMPHPSPRSTGNQNWSQSSSLQATNEESLKWMDVALTKAEDSLRAGEVPVGCLFVYEGEMIATGNNRVNETRNATRHAEINCIDVVLEFCADRNLNYKEVFNQLDVIVTVEPCVMCAAALQELKVQSIVYGCNNDRFGGCGSVFEVSTVYEDGVRVTGGVKAEEAMKLLKEFYKGTNPNAPVEKMGRGRRKKGKKARGGKDEVQ